MRRREFITLLAGAAATWPLVGRAQQPSGKVYRIGYLGVASHAGYAREIEALLKGLHQLGYEEGKNIAIHYQFAEGDYNRLPALAAELVALKVDVLLTHSTPGARAARQTTPTVPIVVMAAADLVSSGLVPSIARPGGNLTGLTFFFAEICAKRVELIKEAVPGVTRLGVLVNPANPSGEAALTAMQRTARSLRVELLTVNVRAVDDIAAAFAMQTQSGWQYFFPLRSRVGVGPLAGLRSRARTPRARSRPGSQCGTPSRLAVRATAAAKRPLNQEC